MEHFAYLLADNRSSTIKSAHDFAKTLQGLVMFALVLGAQATPLQSWSDIQPIKLYLLKDELHDYLHVSVNN
eukprot:3665427-Heterocapsa_arctica.AAC.1